MPPLNSSTVDRRSSEEPADAAVVGTGAGIGRRIRELRLRAGMTLNDLSRMTGVSIGTLSQLERDLVSPTVRTVFTVANALGVPAAWLIDPSSRSAGHGSAVHREGQSPAAFPR